MTAREYAHALRAKYMTPPPAKRVPTKEQRDRKKRASLGWWNWHVNRGRVPGLGSPPSSYREFEKWRRYKSWRRAL